MDIEIIAVNPLILEEGYGLPAYAHASDAGMDIRACIKRPVVIGPLETHIIDTGFAIHLNNSSAMAMIVPRSGLGIKEGKILANGVGIIDSGYQGEVQLGIWNRNDSHSVTVEPGERLAQMIIVPVIQGNFIRVDEFSNTSVRSGGLGSTGKQ